MNRETSIDMPLLNSTAIARVEYDESNQHLNIWFHRSGGPYTYFGVPKSIYSGLLSAASAGRYFDFYIRDKYSSNR
jgi:KTSC domain